MWRKKSSQVYTEAGPRLACSFCRKSQDDVKKLIAGPSIYICDECVEVCNDILADDAAHEQRRKAADTAVEEPEVADGRVEGDTISWPADASVVRCALCRMPTPVSDSVSIENRGVVCVGCLDAVEAAAAERRRID